MAFRLTPTESPTVAHIKKYGERWRAEVCVDNKRRAKTFDTKREAVAWATSQEQDGILAQHTVKDALERYRPVAEVHKGWQSELSRLRALEILSNYSLESLTPSVISSWRDNRLLVVSPVSVRREMIILSSVLRLCRDEWGWMRHDPLKTVKKPSAGPARRRGISQDEIDTITANLLKMRVGKQVADMFHLSIETGMRLSEMLNLTWGDYFAKYVVLVETKNGDPRPVPLSKLARQIVAGRRGIDPQKMFTLNAHVVSQTFRRATINGVHFHDARSEAVTRLSKKLDIMQLCRVIGMRDPRSLMFYYAEKPEDIADRL